MTFSSMTYVSTHVHGIPDLYQTQSTPAVAMEPLLLLSVSVSVSVSGMTARIKSDVLGTVVGNRSR